MITKPVLILVAFVISGATLLFIKKESGRQPKPTKKQLALIWLAGTAVATLVVISIFQPS